jgi:hypothetical protein
VVIPPEYYSQWPEMGWIERLQNWSEFLGGFCHCSSLERKYFIILCQKFLDKFLVMGGL